ncbi:hypothetical protein GXW83_16810 [Streptacidiphilus sp. PB12-B1b]|uniref:hypothetical protein n=1 Tax=Streptacidiphilus sp. PB12-B1b TaxID=2705012 RepID=UPI0015F9B850|nr:hypothetical protein [Streptacidiphilus sp. PB12-B1b]QMU77124.1 hypothetical protein GXW83_16810 [Streptacidiphilus sp. PB12-B1b]
MRTGLKTDRAAGLALRMQPAGHALLIHPRSGADPQAIAFASGLAPDPQHTLVVVDLPFGGLEEGWERVARLLEGRPATSLRLVFGRATPADARTAGQRIAERLGRTVLVPDGEILPTAGGGLFIPADHGSGWLRLRPGRPAERDSHRFPKPLWEFSTLDRPWETSPYGVVEAVPSGVWVRSTRPNPPSAGWRRLVDHLPSDPHIMNVVLGSPGGPAVPLADIVRFWGTVLHSIRSWVRFVHYGPVSLPEGSVSLGQELADAFKQRVVLYAGMPTTEGVPGGPARMRGLRADGSPGWVPFAAELVYSPRDGDVQAPPPALVGLRVPVTEVPEITAGVYQYAADAVLEIVQAGLWLRPTEEPPSGDDVRRLQGGPGQPVILYDRSTPQTAERMRTLAQDMLWHLDPESREAFRIAPADDPGLTTATSDEDAWRLPPAALTAERWRVVTAARAAQGRPAREAPWTAVQTDRDDVSSPVLPAAAIGGVEHATAVNTPVSAASSVPTTAPGIELPDAAGQAAARPTVPVRAASVAAAPEAGATPSTPPVAPVFASAQPGPPMAARPQTESAQGAWSGSAAPEPRTATAAAAASTPPVPPWVQVPPAPVVPAPLIPDATTAPKPTRSHSVVPEPTPASAAVTPVSPVSPAPPAEPAAPQTEPAPMPVPTARVEPVRTPPMAIPHIRMESEAPAPAAVRPGGDGNITPATPDAPALPAAPSPAPGGQSNGVRVQGVPRGAACVAVPERGIEQERAWVRRTFSAQYNAVAGSVARVMSQAPGLRGAARGAEGEALTDLVAVRLYLSGDTAAVDAAVRAGTVGPHVPLARCVASGLGRLPSYRGTALLQTRVSAAELAWYRPGRVATEWAFCTARTDPHRGPDQGTDFLIWSLTARRTNLLDPEPAVADRVLFLPGTAFKVLRTDDGDRPTVLLRELSPQETAEDTGGGEGQRVPLDEIALESLERSLALLSADGGCSTTGGPLPGPPGLITTPASVSGSGSSSGGSGS